MNSHTISLCALVSCVVLLTLPREGWTQDIERTKARVTYVSGANFYLDVGSKDGLTADDALEVYRDGTRLGEVTVHSTSTNSSIVSAIGTPFPVTRGMTLYVSLNRAKQGADNKPLPDVSERTESAPPPPLNEASTGKSRARNRSQVHGQVNLSLNLLESTTAWSSGDPGSFDRRFANPAVRVAVRATNLPGSIAMKTRLRADYRYASTPSIDDPVQLRVYELIAERSVSRLLLRAGRFTNHYALGSGYWDGVLLYFGHTGTGVGTAIGYMPERGSQDLSSDVPRVGAFARVRMGESARYRYSAALSFDELRPTDGRLNHRFFSGTQSLHVGVFSLMNDIQLDRDPVGRRWMASRVSLRAGVRTQRVNIRAAFDVRQPYSIYSVQDPFSYRRDRYSGGLSIRVGSASVGGDWTFNRAETGFSPSGSETVTGYVRIPRTDILSLGFDASAGRWDAGSGTSLYAAAGINRQFRHTRVRAGYRLRRVEFLSTATASHTVVAAVTAALGRRFYTSAQAQVVRGEALNSVSLFVTTGYSF